MRVDGYASNYTPWAVIGRCGAGTLLLHVAVMIGTCEVHAHIHDIIRHRSLSRLEGGHRTPRRPHAHHRRAFGPLPTRAPLPLPFALPPRLGCSPASRPRAAPSSPLGPPCDPFATCRAPSTTVSRDSPGRGPPPCVVSCAEGVCCLRLRRPCPGSEWPRRPPWRGRARLNTSETRAAALCGP